MDWFTLVLIFFFFVLPLIQQGIEQARRSKGLPPIEGEEGEEFWVDPDDRPWSEDDVGTSSGTVSSRSVPSGEENSSVSDRPSWSEGWLPWPTEQTSEEDTSFGTESGRVTRAPAESTGAIPIPERKPERSRSAPSVEDVGRSHTPLEEVARRRKPRPVAEPLPSTSYRDAVPGYVLPPSRRRRERVGSTASIDQIQAVERLHSVSGRGRSSSRLAGILANTESVRRAVILNEVLGPPVALRDLDGERRYKSL